MFPRFDVVIVGGGITGLVAAHRLAERLGPDRIRLFERSGRVGGKLVTERTNGFLIEGGPDCMLRIKPAGAALCRDLRLEAEIIGTRSEKRGTHIVRGGRLHRLPSGAGLVPTRILPLARSPLLSLKGRARAAYEWFVSPNCASDESIEAFASRRFGDEAYRWLLEPLLCGIHAGDGNQLSLSATFPQLAKMEHDHGGVLRGARRRGTGPAPFAAPMGGMAEIVSALRRNIPEFVLHTDADVTAVERIREGFRVSVDGRCALEADAVILATPAFAAGQLMMGLDEELARALDGIPFVSTSTVSLAYAPGVVGHPLDGYGYVVPRAEGGPVVACTWTSSKFWGRAPDGAALLRLFIGRAGDDGIVFSDDDVLIDVARDEVRRMLGITAAPEFTRIFRWPRALPQYTVGHAARVAAIERMAARHPGLVLAGASYHGVGVPDCIASANAAADAAAAFADGRQVRAGSAP